MVLHRGFVVVAATLLGLGGITMAQDSRQLPPPPDEYSEGGSLTPPPVLPSPVLESPTGELQEVPQDPQRGAIMSELDRVGGVGGWLDSQRTSVYGFVEGGYLYDFNVPSGSTPNAAPNDFVWFPGTWKGEPLLDQLDLTVERTINPLSGKFQIGFKVEGIYGHDAVFTHSSGFFQETGNGGGFARLLTGGQADQFDMPQAYVDMNIPVGNGIEVVAGKWASLLGYEHLNPTENTFYTHSYIWGYGIPEFTETGLLGRYTIGPTLTNPSTTTVTGAISEGFNKTIYTNGIGPDGTLQATHVTGPLSWTASILFGSETPDTVNGPKNRSDYWLMPEFIIDWQASDRLHIGTDILYGEGLDSTPLLFSSGEVGWVHWFGIAGYASYYVDRHVTVNARLEYYHDGAGATTGVAAVPSGSFFTDINYYEVTLGTTVKPLPDSPLFQSLEVRPELRVDWSDQGVFDPISGDYNTLSAAVDALWRF